MKIGFVIDDGLDSPDGVQQYVLGLGSWLANEGHEVHYIVGETKRSDIQNLHVLSRNIQVRFNANTLSTPLPASKRKIRTLLESEKFDILHIQIPYSPFMAARVMKLAPQNAKIVGTFHVLPFSNFQKFCTKALGMWLRRSSKNFSTVIAVSPPAGKFCKESFGLEPMIIGNHIDIAKYEKAVLGIKPIKKSKIRIVYLGRLVSRKGCMELLKAIYEIKLRRLTKEKFEVLIGGSGPEEDKLEKYIKSHNLDDYVKLVGYIDDKEKPGFLHRADIGIFPSISGESFGIVLLEAMAAKCEVVLAGNNPGYSSVYEELPEVLFDPKNTFEFANKLAYYINDSKKRRIINLSQQKIVKKYDINSVGQAILITYTGLAKSFPSRQTKSKPYETKER